MTQRKNVIGEAGGVGIVLFDLQFGFVIEQTIEYIRSIPHGRVDELGIVVLVPAGLLAVASKAQTVVLTPLDTFYAKDGGPLGIWRQWAPDAHGQAMKAGHFFPEENPGDTAVLVSSSSRHRPLIVERLGPGIVEAIRSLKDENYPIAENNYAFLGRRDFCLMENVRELKAMGVNGALWT